MGGTAAARPQELARDQGDVPVDPGDAHPVSAARPYRSGDMRTVKVDVEVARTTVVNRIVAVEEIPPVDVVRIAVAVIVHAVDGIEWVVPDIGGQIWMGEVDTLVDDADVDSARAGEPAPPRLGRLTAELVSGNGALAVHSPERPVRKGRIVRRGIVP